MNNDFYIPSEVFACSQSEKYMACSYPIASDFFHPKFSDFLARIHHPFQMHRKLWEFAYIDYQLDRAGALKKGATGLCFGVGREKLPALFAAQGCLITATDAPHEVGKNWTDSGEFADNLQSLNFEEILSRELFLDLVNYRTCDMNNIDSDLIEYDFCWSACCLEHLGSLRAGLDFILNSLNTIRIGGVAVHTTELNLSSNTQTVDNAPTVLYRRKDLEEFVSEVRNLGHEINDIIIQPLATPIDHHVDMPPYTHNPHLKLMIEKFVTTSVGLVVTRRV